MNPVGAEGNIFEKLFDKVPARREGNAADMAGTILYLASKAGVSPPSQGLTKKSIHEADESIGLREWHKSSC